MYYNTNLETIIMVIKFQCFELQNFMVPTIMMSGNTSYELN